jgi:hypothetical protein
MKKHVFLSLVLAVLFTVPVYAVDTVYVHNDVSPNEGAINTAVQAAIDAGTLSNTVFKLDPYGYYILSGTVTVPPNQKLTIVADEPGRTQETAPPQIFLSAQIPTWRYTFNVFGDISLKNVWLVYATTSGAQQSASMDIDEDTLRNKNTAEFDGVIFDYAPVNGSVEIRATHFVGKFKNCYWRNNIDPHYRYYGRAVSYPYQSTTWHTDSISFVNCTFANMGYAYMGYFPNEDTPEGADYVWFNHCTFTNTMMHSLEPSFWNWVSVTNCLFNNIYMYGNIPNEGGGLTGIPSGGILNIDSIALAKPSAFPNGMPIENQRHILLANNSYFNEQWLLDYMDHGNAYSDTASALFKPRPMPMISTKTALFFDSVDAGSGLKAWPYVNKANLYDGIDPGLYIPPTNQDGIKAFLLGRWATGANVDWAYDVQSDLAGGWPMNEDLSYSNSTLMAAGMGGFPLGDLYHWWPSQYNAWKAQEATENEFISNWLTTGNAGNAVNRQPDVPTKFELTQNYPNPFNPTTQIIYSVPQSGQMSLKVYNLLGEEVTTLFEGVQQPGTYIARFDGSKFSSGVYFYTLKAGSVSMTRKLALVK